MQDTKLEKKRKLNFQGTIDPKTELSETPKMGQYFIISYAKSHMQDGFYLDWVIM